MDRLSRIRNIIRWQELYQDRRAVVATYKDNEDRSVKLKEEFKQAKINQEKFSNQYEALSVKIKSEELKLDELIAKIDTMEQDRDNLKMARQIKSWEKDMERFSQDREIVEAQLYYDKSKIGELAQEVESLTESLTALEAEIKILDTALFKIKSETAGQMNQIEQETTVIFEQFDTHFAEYFERLLVKNKGVVMAVVEEDSCSGCNALLPTSYHGGNSLQDADDLALPQCPNCFRYLYYSEDV